MIYFIAGFSFKEIWNFLFLFHRIKITIRHLSRLLRQCNLQRRGNHSNINTVIKFIQGEMKCSSLCFGYRYMLQKLRSSGLTPNKETFRLILKSLDLVAVDRRKRWKPFGIAIHGAIFIYLSIYLFIYLFIKTLFTVGI